MLGPSSKASTRIFGRQVAPITTRGYAVPASVLNSHIAHRTPGAPAATDYPEARRSAADFKTTTLDNGVKIVTLDTAAANSAVGLFVRSGPRFETAEEVGASHFVRRLAFTRTDTRSPVTVVRDMEKYTDNFACSTARDHTSYTASSLQENVPAVLYMLNDILNPKLHEYIVRDVGEDVYREALEAEHCPETAFTEALHREAFRNVGLARSRFAPSNRVGKITPEVLRGFMTRTYVAENMAVVGLGVNHDEFANLVKEVLSSFSPSSSKDTTKAEYVGGDVRIATEDEYTHIGVAFQGVADNDKDAYALSVFSHLVGGDAKYSRNGPGRGVTTRLYKNVVQKLDSVRAAATLNASYADAGLWGIYAEAERGHVKAVADALAGELASLRKGSFEANEVSGAKNRAKAAFLTCLDTSCGQLAFAGRRALQGSDASLATASAGFDAVTPDDVARVAKKVLSSEPTLVVHGDVEGAPTTKSFRS